MNYGSIQCTTHKNDTLKEASCKDFIILYNLENTLIVTIDDCESILAQGDVIIINQGSTYHCSSHGFYAKYTLDANHLKSCFANKKYTFICDSSKDFSSNYDRLRKLLSEILIVLYNNHKFTVIKLNQIFYDLVLFLLQNFAIEQLDVTLSEKDELINYIDNHYMEDLSLQKISEDFHMSAQYFSKYFKKHVGIPYLTYLIDIRLNYALKEVVDSDKRFITIAMDNGFPNISAFNHYFKDKYKQTPEEYRLRNKVDIESSADLSYAIKNLSIKPELDVNLVSIEADAKDKKQYTKFWKKLIHLGNSNLLDDAQVLSQFKDLQHDLQFEYVRVFLDYASFKKNETYNFIREENQFNELYRMGFKIWISFEFRDIKDIDLTCDYLKSFLSFIIGQWSIKNIQEWYFELTYNSTFEKEEARLFCEYADRIKAVLEMFGCADRLIVAGLTLGNKKGIENLYAYLEENHLIFKNQSFQVEPYLYYTDNKGNEIIKGISENDIHNDFLMLKQTNSYFKNFVEHSYITSWKDNLRQSNIMNDSCYKGALMIKKFLECFGQIDSISSNIALDSMYDLFLQNHILFGGNGLMNRHGIKKPSFYAYSFMSYVGDNHFLKRNENVAVFANDNGNYQIIAHNCKQLGYRYFMEEDHLDVHNLHEYFENEDKLDIHIRISNVENGFYKIKKRSISSEGGSVQDALIRMSGENMPFIHPHDIDFLKSISIPFLHLDEIEIKDNILDIHVILEANEFVFLHIVHEF